MSPESQRKFELLNLLAESYDALLFDVDGTLADNMDAHKQSYKAAAQQYGVELDVNLIDETAGWPTVAVAEEISKRYGVDFDYQEFSTLKSTIFRDEYVFKTKPVDYVVEHLKYQKGKKHIAAVSGGTRTTLSMTLTTIGVWDDLETLVCAGDTPEGKPSPQPFLLAAAQLNISPERCLVYEDGIPGVEGAKAAGMGWVRVDEI
ncbi:MULTISPECIES: HAD family hydrolase [Sphingobacterium]|uniref:HAD family hydrolase n=1 Tax=Sphingobacterium TaxID=28453 RepID=UPI000627AF0B|nr:HAD-IA family hydrolase [Sphingobacterium sp. Ag1]KKO91465.1 phosphatase [Sphingobacterium sp. Ag1]